LKAVELKGMESRERENSDEEHANARCKKGKAECETKFIFVVKAIMSIS
jgi:hypothetical protein